MGVKCEVCGNENIKKQDGCFSCTQCGIQYSLEDLQRMISSPPSRIFAQAKEASLFKIVGTIKHYNTPYPKVTELVIPSIINGCKITTIGKRSFGYAHNSEDEDTPAPGNDLIKIRIEEGIETIDEDAFRDLHLEEVNLPDSVREIKRQAFKNCINLKTLHFVKKVPNKRLFIDHLAFDCCFKLEYFTIEDRGGKITTIPKSTGYITI